MMQDNGSVSKKVKYRNLCKEQFTVHVAYIHQSEWFEIENNSMVDIVVKYQVLHGLYTNDYYIPYDYEILSIFFKHYDIIVKWINCRTILVESNSLKLEFKLFLCNPRFLLDS